MPTETHTNALIGIVYGDTNEVSLSANSGNALFNMYAGDIGTVEVSVSNNSVTHNIRAATRSVISLRNNTTTQQLVIRSQGSQRVITGLTPPINGSYAVNKDYADRLNRLWAVSNGTTTGTWAGVPSVLVVDSANKWKMNLHYNATSSYENPTLLGLKISAGFTAKDNAIYTMTITQSGGGLPDATVLTVKSSYQNSVFAVAIVDLAMLSSDSDITFTASFNNISGILQPYMIIEALEFYM